MVEAKLSMAFSEDEVTQLTGLIPRPQGFHKRCIALQDSIDMLFKGCTVGDKGSLFHIKNKFGFRTVKKKISDCVNSVVDFFNFVTEASVCMIVCNILNIESISDVLPEDEAEKQEMFEDICKSVVRLVWPQIDLQSIQQAEGREQQSGEGDTDVDTDADPSQDDTSEYWNEDAQEFDDTLPYEDSENEIGRN
jgi:hypothetical protein